MPLKLLLTLLTINIKLFIAWIQITDAIIRSVMKVIEFILCISVFTVLLTLVMELPQPYFGYVVGIIGIFSSSTILSFSILCLWKPEKLSEILK